MQTSAYKRGLSCVDVRIMIGHFCQYLYGTQTSGKQNTSFFEQTEHTRSRKLPYDTTALSRNV